MNQAMKQRLVGTLVLGCLAIILVPLFLDGKGIQSPPLTATIPAAPQFDAGPIAEPVRPTITADSLPAPGKEAAPAVADTKPEAPTPQPLPAFNSKEAAPAPVKKSTSSAQPDALEAAVATIIAKEKQGGTVASNDATPHMDSSGLPQSFVVRLGVFSEKARAEALLAKLRAANYKAYSRVATTVNGPQTLVYVGPVLTRAEANSMLAKLNSTYHLSALVETFSGKTAQ